MTTTTSQEKLGLEVLAFLGQIALLAASLTWRGYVLSVLWGWFVVRGFGLVSLSVPLAMGLALIVSFLTVSLAKTERSWTERIGLAALMPAMVLLIGWIVTKFL